MLKVKDNIKFMIYIVCVSLYWQSTAYESTLAFTKRNQTSTVRKFLHSNTYPAKMVGHVKRRGRMM